MSSVPTSFYDIHPNDDHDQHQNFMAPIDASSNMGPGELVRPTPFDKVPAPSFPIPNNISATQAPHEQLPAFLMNEVTDDTDLAPAFSTYNAIPRFRIPFPFAMTSSRFFSGLPTSPENTLVPCASASCGIVPKRKRNRKPKDKHTKRNAAKPAKSKRAHARRTRGPTRNTRGKRGKPYCSGFEDMFNKLPLEVQRALNTFYTGCCESMTDRDNSTRQKHMFSKRHYENLPKEFLDILPCFVCPAYIAFHGACTSAKPGRYDSTERHCRSCAGFQEMNSESQILLFPLKITKGEYEAIRIYRTVSVDANDEDKEKNRPLVANSVNKLLGVTGNENFQIHENESNLPEAIHAVFRSLGMM
ncbi:hypothetical protein V8E52_005140 [Russula decolorans]